MIVAFTGDRHWRNIELVGGVLDLLLDGTHVLVGDARGLDTIAYNLACVRDGLSVTRYYAPWELMGKAAGPYRNKLILEDKPDLVIAFHNDLEHSKGTKNMVAQAQKRGIEVQLISENNK